MNPFYFNFITVCLLWYFYISELRSWYHFIDSFEEKYKLKVYNKRDERWKKRGNGCADRLIAVGLQVSARTVLCSNLGANSLGQLRL